MKTSHSKITEVVVNNRFIADRIKLLGELGYNVIYRFMGSGGVLQEAKGRKCTYIQIGYGTGKYNYAPAVKIDD